jgi:hypothetical protein
VIYLSAAFLILVGLPCMALCHKVVAERMDDFEMKQSQLSSEDRQSIGSRSQRSTSMSALRLPAAIHFATDQTEAQHLKETNDGTVEEDADVGGEEDEEETPETRPALASVDLTHSNHQDSALTSLFDFSGRSEVIPIDSEKEEEKEASKDTWLNFSCSYFLRGCHRLQLISMEDL